MSLRIIAGRLKGRRLEAPETHLTRPTADKVREAVFSMLTSLLYKQGLSFDHCRVLDAFAGSGALGLEAFSRGAREGAFIEQNMEAYRILLSNMEHVGAATFHAYRRDACDPGKPHGTFNLVFLDPPYDKNLIPKAVRALDAHLWLDESVLLVIEIGAKEKAPTLPGFTCIQGRTYGACQILFFTRA